MLNVVVTLINHRAVRVQAHRGCPICRQHSDFVVASDLHLTGDERKVGVMLVARVRFARVVLSAVLL